MSVYEIQLGFNQAQHVFPQLQIVQFNVTCDFWHIEIY